MSRSLAELDAFKVLHLDFENNFEDSSGNGNDGTPTGIEWKPTRRGMKPQFDGSTSFIECGDLPHGAISTEMTVVAWIYMTQYGNISSEQTIISKNNLDEWELEIENNNEIKLIIDGVSVVSSSVDIPLNTWCVVSVSFDNGDVYMYLNGELVHSDTSTMPPSIPDTLNPVLIGQRTDGTGPSATDLYFNGSIDDTRIYNTALDAAEALALYNATKQGHGVLYHERSYTHRLSPEVDSSTVFATDMHTREGSQLADLSGNGNHGTLGAVGRTGGYFTDGLNFDNADAIITTPTISYNPSSVLFECLCKPPAAPEKYNAILTASNSMYCGMYYNDIMFGETNWVVSFDRQIKISNVIPDSVMTHIVICYDNVGHVASFYVDGVHVGDAQSADQYGLDAISVSHMIGYDHATYGTYGLSYVWFGIDATITPDTIKSRFNTLAVLPLYHIDFSRYPSNTTVYDSNIPYSSMRVDSGSFKVDGGQLVCVTDGIIKMRNSHNFDGSEYVSITADGVKTSDTTTVTAGTTTASIEQGSNLISIEMDAADVLDNVYIQFRAPVA